MSSLVIDRSFLDHTAAVPCRSDPFHLSGTGTGQPVGTSVDGKALITLISGVYYLLSEASLAERMTAENRMLLGEITSSRPPPLVQLPYQGPVETASISTSPTAAQAMVAETRAISGLTNEEIAPLVGVSRRSLQAWAAGESISARKEQRLRALLDAIREMAAPEPSETRCRLLDRVPGDVRAYDLLLEGRYQEAADMGLGRRSPGDAATATVPQTHDLSAQLDHHEEHVELPPERLDRRFSGRLRR